MLDLEKILSFELNRIAQQSGQIRDTRHRPLIWATAIAAIPVAYALLFATALRQNATVPKQRRTIIVAHHEWSNRTKHVLQSDIGDGAVVWAGRSRNPNYNFLKENKSLEYDIESSFALDLRSGLSIILTSFFTLAKAGRCLSKSGIGLTTRQVFELIFRLSLGLAHAGWWRRSGLTPETVVFGHTGNVDCTVLELAIQHSGAKTVHAVHGVGHEWEFAGLSDLSIYTNAHDAASAPADTYKKATSLPLEMPALRNSPAPSLVLTSYTHPMNPEFHSGGHIADKTVLNWAINADLPQPILWQPHPAIELVGETERQHLTNLTKAHQIERNSGDLDLKDAGIILTTPSTIALECLKAGKLPIIMAVEPPPKGSVYNHFDIATSAASLNELITIYKNNSKVAERFQQVWAAVRPSGSLDRKSLETALATQEGR